MGALKIVFVVVFCLLLNLPCGREQEQVGTAMEPGAPDAEAARVATVLCVIPSPALVVLARQGRLAAQRGSPVYPHKIGERKIPTIQRYQVRSRILVHTSLFFLCDRHPRLFTILLRRCSAAPAPLAAALQVCALGVSLSLAWSPKPLDLKRWED